MSPETVTADSGNFDPQQAAALLDQTTRRAVRKFEPFPPWLAVLRGLGVLAIYGAVWLTVRRRQPLLIDSPTSKSARNLERVDPECARLDYVRETRAASLTTVVSNKFAFGGLNTSLVLRRA